MYRTIFVKDRLDEILMQYSGT